ncbi:contractile injection system protein, VgrG/Pvc8 family [Halomonas koreensis]|uniref:Contractile injection system protein, VgrG/Pvc8 family n=1 Tax=Halomonas koreensis TaxID=245385 RepID=A0ABU1FYD5_9GAMM|nr:contractile injection system protein, VgrG/Pvc8 family [Halomonas koreensis]MDR5865685.1 contractile injection system protein, VgrG/Pvc8 family [Halomonas koreensis]
MLQTKKTRSWEAGTTLGDMVRTIAGEHGLEPAVQDAMDGIGLSHIDQTDESDTSLLTRLAHQYDGIIKPGGGRLLLAQRAASQSAGGEGGGQTLPTVVITPDMESRGRMKLAKRGAAGSVVARWRDTEAAASLEITEGKGEPVQRLQTIYPDEAAARSAARAALRRGQRGEQALELTLPGNTALMAEGRLSLSGFREGADGEWLITEVQHRLDASGFSSLVKGELPGDDS